MADRRFVRFSLITLLLGLFPGPVQAEPGQQRGEKYAFLVGVRKYDPNELRSLPYSEADVVALADVLRQEGYRSDNVVLMTQTLGAEDTRFLPLASHILKELNLLLQELDEDDSVLVAFAGHGVQFRGDKESYFCPADARLADKTTLVALSAVYRALDASKAGLKVLLVNACRNDPQSDNSRSRSVVDLESVTRPAPEVPPGGIVAFFSCSRGEKAFEHDDLKHGVFFNYVIEARPGAAVNADEREVFLPDLEKYVKKRVPAFVRARYGVQQMPESTGTTQGLVPLVVLNRSNAPVRPDTPGSGASITNSVGMKLVRIPAGSFTMGSPDGEGLDNEHPAHPVEITRPFFLAATEVTQGQYERVMKANPSHFSGTELPVENVSYDDATEFCRRLARLEGLPETSYRLPTEAEWEYAARRDDSPANGLQPLVSSAWFKDDSGRATHPVAQKAANARGLYDMAGNVAEWCLDWLGPYPSGPQRDPTGPAQPGPEGRRVLRGGSWLSQARGCRPVDRDGADPQTSLNLYGFRVVKVSPAP